MSSNAGGRHCFAQPADFQEALALINPLIFIGLGAFFVAVFVFS
jgi:hypothetical protein